MKLKTKARIVPHPLPRTGLMIGVLPAFFFHVIAFAHLGNTSVGNGEPTVFIKLQALPPALIHVQASHKSLSLHSNTKTFNTVV